MLIYWYIFIKQRHRRRLPYPAILSMAHDSWWSYQVILIGYLFVNPVNWLAYMLWIYDLVGIFQWTYYCHFDIRFPYLVHVIRDSLYLIIPINFECVVFNWSIANSCMHYIDGFMQERRSSIAKALELRISCTNPSISNDILAFLS